MQQAVQTLHTGGVAIPDRHLLDDLPANELNPVVLAQNARFNHALIVVDGEQMHSLDNHFNHIRSRDCYKSIVTRQTANRELLRMARIEA
jgi:hypothetical protein